MRKITVLLLSVKTFQKSWNSKESQDFLEEFYTLILV